MAAVVGPSDDAGRLVGRVYAANTVGAILGSALFSVVVIPHWGTRHGEQLLIAISLASAMVVFAAVRRARAVEAANERDAQRSSGWVPRPAGTLLAVAGAAAAIALRDRGAERSRRARGVRTLSPDVHEPTEVPLRRRRDELLDRRLGGAERRAQLPRRGQGRGVEPAAGHAAPANARTPVGDVDEDAAHRARRRIRRGRDGRVVRDSAGRRADRDLRDRAADSASRVDLLHATRTTTSRTTRACRSSTTTRGTTS